MTTACRLRGGTRRREGGHVRGFLARARQYFKDHGVRIERVLTDNGTGYRGNALKAAVLALKAKHLRTRPYRPQTNGKAERFIQTMLREWAYGRIYARSSDRRRALPAWVRRYNRRRPHGSLGGKPLLTAAVSNVLGRHSRECVDRLSTTRWMVRASG